MEALFQAVPTSTPSAAGPALAMSFGELKPLPPMMGTFQPSCRAWETMVAACSTSADTMRNSGFLAFSAVSWALKSRSFVAKVWMSTIGTPWPPRARPS